MTPMVEAFSSVLSWFITGIEADTTGYSEAQPDPMFQLLMNVAERNEGRQELFFIYGSVYTDICALETKTFNGSAYVLVFSYNLQVTWMDSQQIPV